DRFGELADDGAGDSGTGFIAAIDAVCGCGAGGGDSRMANFSASSSAEPRRADHRIRDADDSAGDPSGKHAELSGHRHSTPATDVGIAGQRWHDTGAEPD